MIDEKWILKGKRYYKPDDVDTQYMYREDEHPPHDKNQIFWHSEENIEILRQKLIEKFSNYLHSSRLWIEEATDIINKLFGKE